MFCHNIQLQIQTPPPPTPILLPVPLFSVNLPFLIEIKHYISQEKTSLEEKRKHADFHLSPSQLV